MARRLKKPIRRTLMGLGICAEVASAITLANGTLFVKQAEVHAQANPKEVINIISKLKNNELSKMKTLKSYVLDTYQSVNMIDDLDTEQSKVLLVTPTVVTEPTVSNSSIVIVPVATSTTNSETVETVSPDTSSTTQEQTNVEETKGDSQGGSSTIQERSKDTIDSSVATPEPTSEAVKTESTPGVKETEEADERSVASVETSQKQSEADSKGSEETVKADEAVVKDVVEDDVKEKIDEPEALNDFSVFELKSLGEDEEVSEESLEKMDLRLRSDKVLLEDGSDFVAEDYIENIESGSDILPTLKISGKVDSYTDGEYKVTYTLVGANGATISKELTVTVKGNEEAKKAREEARQKAIDAFVEKYSGKHIDVDGYYGDQCWDLWGRFICDLGLYSKYDCGTGSYGYAYGVYLRYDKTNAKKYFEKIEDVAELKAGDWLFWDKGSSCPDSHVALLLKNNGDGTGECLTQSYGEGTRVMTLKLDVMGGFRPTGSADWYKLAGN